MKRFFYLIMFLSCLVPTVYSQGVGTWQTYLAYYTTTQVAEAGNYVFAVADGSLYSYGKEDNSITYYSRQSGLSDNSISKIAYNQEVKALLIVYSNGNIDLLDEKGNVYNLPFLKDNTTLQNKAINDIYFDKEYAYLSMPFGIMVVNMKKREITDTYKLGTNTYSACIKDNILYAATDKGVLYCEVAKNLLDVNNWSNYNINIPNTDESNKIIQIHLFQNNLCFQVKQKGIYYQDKDEIKSLITDSYIARVKIVANKLVAFTTNRLFIWSDLSNRNILNLSNTITDISSYTDNNTYWIADNTNGLSGIKVKGYGLLETTITNLLPTDESPKRNLDYFLTTYQKNLYIAGGGRWTNRYDNPGTFSLYDGTKWFNFNENDTRTIANVTTKDYTGVAIDPKDPTHYFVSSYGEGILEFKDNQFVKLHNHTNSTLTTSSSSNPYNYVRIPGIAFDKEGNLWATNCKSNSTVHVLKADGTWKAMPYSQKISDVDMMDKILITSRGDKWLNIPYNNYAGIFVFNENKTIDDTSDDLYEHYTNFRRVSGETIDASSYYCVAEDKSGDIWMGTNKGILICPASAARYATNNENNKVYCNQIIRYDADGTPGGYFLNGERVNAIAVDGGNRKWIGTESSGIFLVNEDGSETINNFTTENSPLLSNNILSIAINEINGEVFVGTDKGLISYMGGASEGSESYSEVYAYPNPVRPEHPDQVTITGLMADSNVKITDMAGNIIYQAKSLGGQLTWNCRNHSGKRIASGIYLVMAATPEGKEGVVTKIIVMK